MEFGVFVIIVVTVISFFSLYKYQVWNFDYWNKRRVVGPKPTLFFGNFKDVLLGKINEAIVLKKIYDDYKSEALVGIYVGGSPRLVIRDVDLIKDVLIKDFNVFPDRDLYRVYEKANPFYSNLFNLEYKRWKPLRGHLTPIFSLKKLKDMFYLVADCAENFQKYADRLVELNEPVECRELTAKFTTDTIGVCVFGLNMNAVDNENSRFRNFGKSIFDVNFKNRLKSALRTYFPAIYGLVGPLLELNSDNKFFINSVKETMQYRKDNHVRRNDFLDFLMDLKENPEKLNDLEITDNLLIAQAFVFFVGGFETSSTAMSNALYELALNPSVQTKLRQEILQELAKNDGKLTYDCVKNMTYLEKVVKESMRKYPIGTILHRKAASSYTFNNTNLTIPKETKVMIPVWAIHRDPEIYPNPEKFDPERFNDKNEKLRHPMYYLPFGAGPHNCIGLRFANCQLALGIAAIIEKFQINTCVKSCKDYQLEPRAGIPTPIGGLYVQLSRIESNM